MNKEDDIVGNLLGVTTPTEIAIRVSPRIVRREPLQLGEYLMIDYQHESFKEPVLARVSDIRLENLNMPASVLNRPEDFRALSMMGDLSEGEVLTARAVVVGYLDKRNKLVVPRFTPPPGAAVRRATTELLSRAFGHGHVRIGVLRSNEQVEVKLDVNEITRRHLAILAITGGGKGNTVAVLTSGVLALGGTVLIVDPHNEYLQMRESVHGKVQIFSAESDLTKGIRPLRFRFSSFRPEDYFSILRISEAAHKQRALLRRVLGDLQGTTWDLDDLRTALSRTGDDTEAQEQSSSIIDRIDGTTEFVVFDKTEEVPLRGTPGLLTKGFMTVLALAGLDTDVQQAIVRHVCQIVFRAAVRWKRKEDGEKTPGPVLIVVEEAHNFVPSKQTASSSRILTKIASEGRKFGVGLCIVSQRPGKVDSDALSQCNSMIILRIVNPHDQKQIELSAEAMSRDLMDELPGLNVGEAIIFGPAINLPGLVKVDKYGGTLGGEDLDIVSLWSEVDQSEEKIVRQYDDTDSAYRRKRK